MGSYRQTLLHDFPTCVAFLRGEARVHSDYLMTSSCSLLFKNSEECAPASVHDALCQGVILYHVENTQLLNRDHLIVLSVLFGCLIMKVTALTAHFEMGLRRAASSFTASVTAFLTSAQLALLTSQGSLTRAIETWIINGVACAIGQKGLQPYIDADVRMSAFRWSMFMLWLRLTDNEGVPMAVSPMDEMNSLRSTLYGAMQLDLEGFTDLSRNMQMLVISIQPHIAACAILAQLDRVPAVRLLETRETHIRNTQLTGCEKPFERFRETISQHLNCGGRHMLTTTAFELCCQIILRGERASFSILRLGDLKHLVIELARLCQACHEQAGLFLLRIQSKLKRSHILIIAIRERNVNRFVPPAGGRQFIPIAKARGPLAASLVADGNGLSTEQTRWLVARFVGHPGRTISEPAVLKRPLAEQRATYIACTMGGHWVSDEVAAMRKEPNWTFRTLDTGHWPMVSTPDELVALLAEVASEHS